MNAPRQDDIVISGVGIVSPIGVGVEPFWQSLMEAKSGIRQLPGRLGEHSGIAIGGAIEAFDPKQFVRPRKALKVMCREIQTAFSAAVLAQENASLDKEDYPADRIGTVFGSEMMSGEPEELIDALIECGVRDSSPELAAFGQAAMRKMFPLWMLKYLPNMAACHVGIALGALGPNNSVVTGDTSALSAVMESVSVVARGHADCIVSGAAGTRISATRLIFNGNFLPASVRDPIASSSRPMARDRDGVVYGEAAGAFVIEKRLHAEKRDAALHAVVKGLASRSFFSNDGSAGLLRAISTAIAAALEDANVPSAAIGAVVSHSMGHKHYDALEAAAIEENFGPAVPTVCPIASTGHTGAASGAVSLATGCKIISSREIPPTLHAEAQDPECKVRLLNEPEALAEPNVLVLAFTPTGQAVAIVLGAA